MGLCSLAALMVVLGLPLLSHESKVPYVWGFSRAYILGLSVYGTVVVVTLASGLLASARIAHLLRIRLVHRAVFVAAGIFVPLVLIEGVLRLVPPRFWDPDPAVRVGAVFALPDDWVHHLAPANSRATVESPYGEFKVDVQINSDNLRDVEHSVAKPPGTLRILVLGDSMVEAMQVGLEETLGKRLEALLARATGRDVEVINAGVASFSPTLEYLMLRHKGLKYAPDVVVLIFFPADVHDDWTYARELEFDDRGVPLKRKLPKSNAWRDLILGTSDRLKVVRFLLANERLLTREPVPELAISIFESEYSDRELHAWEVTKTALRAASDLAVRHGARFVLVSLPYPFQVEPGDAASSSHILLRSTRPQQILSEFARDLDVPYLDLLPSLRQADVHPLFFPYDLHLTALGHDVTSRAIAEFLRTAVLPGLRLSRASSSAAEGERW